MMIIIIYICFRNVEALSSVKKKIYKIIFQQTKHTFYYMNIVSIQHLTLEAAVTSKEAYEAPVFLNIFP